MNLKAIIREGTARSHSSNEKMSRSDIFLFLLINWYLCKYTKKNGYILSSNFDFMLKNTTKKE